MLQYHIALTKANLFLQRDELAQGDESRIAPMREPRESRIQCGDIHLDEASMNERLSLSTYSTWRP